MEYSHTGGSWDQVPFSVHMVAASPISWWPGWQANLTKAPTLYARLWFCFLLEFRGCSTMRPLRGVSGIGQVISTNVIFC